jgi:hypothetical protein
MDKTPDRDNPTNATGETLLEWIRRKGLSEDFDKQGFIQVDAYLILIQFPGLLSMLNGCTEISDCARMLNAIDRLFDHCLAGLPACQLSRNADEYLFLADAPARELRNALRSIHVQFARGDDKSPGLPEMHPRLACAYQRVRLVNLESRDNPGWVPGSLEYLRAMVAEGRSCRAPLVYGEQVVEDFGEPGEYRLIGLQSDQGEAGPRGMYQDLYSFSEGEAILIRENSRLTNRGISSFHAGLIRESRELFFEALEKAPFDPLPGRYLNLIQRNR